jgi:hypothetical protein
VSSITHLGCAGLAFAGSILFAWMSIYDHNAEWAGLLALGCLLLSVFNLLAIRDAKVESDDWTDR